MDGTPQVPNAPTFKESGYDVEAYGWFALVTPTGVAAVAVSAVWKDFHAISGTRRQTRCPVLAPSAGKVEAAFVKPRRGRDRWSFGDRLGHLGDHVQRLCQDDAVVHAVGQVRHRTQVGQDARADIGLVDVEHV